MKREMNSRKVSIAVIGVIAMLLSLVPLTAMAGTYGITGIDNLAFLYNSGNSKDGSTDYKTGVTLLQGVDFPFQAHSGSYDAIYLGYEASYTDILLGINTYSNTKVFQNQPESSGGNSIGDIGYFNVGTAGYNVQDTSANTPFLASNLKVYGITAAFLNNYNELSSFVKADTNNTIYQYYVVGFGDSTGDKDYDDLVIAMRNIHTTATPIPGAVWLLGSGLLGMIGIRRKKRV